MYMLKYLRTAVLAFICFMALSFLSCDFAFCALYCLLFISEVRGENYINFAAIFLITVFTDIYTSKFIGIYIITLAILFIISRQLKSLLPNSSPKIATCCFFASLCICEFFYSFLIFLLGIDPNLIEHIFQLLLTTLIFIVFSVMEIIFIKIRKSYAS